MNACIKLTTPDGHSVFLDPFAIKVICGTSQGSNIYCACGVFCVQEKPDDILRVIEEADDFDL